MYQSDFPVEEFRSRRNKVSGKIKSRFPKLEIRDLAPIIYEMRMEKSPREIKLLRMAGQLSARGLCEAQTCLKPFRPCCDSKAHLGAKTARD